MATIKIKFRSSSVAGKEGTLCYQVIHGRQTRLISTGYKLHLYEWDKEAGKIRSVKGNPDRERYLEALRFRMEEDQKRLNGIIRKLEQSGKLSSEQIVLAYHSPEGHDDCFFVYARKVIDQTKRMGKERTSEVYASSLNSFIRFRGEAGDVPLDAMDSVMMMEYEAYLKQNGKCPNTVSFYLRNLRTLYNRASEEGLVENRSPFRHVHTGVEKTVKRGVSSEIIGRIKNLDLELYPALAFARNLFLLCFLSSRHVFRGLGFLEKERFAKRRACLSAAQDRPTALHQMGAAHAGNCPEIHKSGFSLPSSHHQGAGRKGKTAIPECLACDEQAVAKDWPDG